MKVLRKLKRPSSFQLILLGFAAVILIGALLLMLPISSKTREVTPFFDALFTSTSAVCVTGLVVVDTSLHFSYFGQAVILLLIQVGGLGVVTVAASISVLAGKKIGLGQRGTVMETISAPSVGGAIRMMRFLVKGVLFIELVGAALLLPAFCRDFGWQGVWLSLFHSVSAFCNAGFDLMGQHSGAFSSLSYYAGSLLVNLVIMLLIIIGGIGFLTWSDIIQHKWHVKRYRMQSKVILLTSAVLIVLPAFYYFFAEFGAYPFKERLLYSLFQAVTPRTAGFNTANFATLGEVSLLSMVVLMLIGGSPGSTAGGIKTTTAALLFASMISIFRRTDDATLFRRRVADDTVRLAAAVLSLYLALFLACGALISLWDELPLLTALFETASAIGTVGLTLGITPTLCGASRIVLVLLMYFGRVGGLTLIYAALGNKQKNLSKPPLDKITVG